MEEKIKSLERKKIDDAKVIENLELRIHEMNDDLEK